MQRAQNINILLCNQYELLRYFIPMSIIFIYYFFCTKSLKFGSCFAVVAYLTPDSLHLVSGHMWLVAPTLDRAGPDRKPLTSSFSGLFLTHPNLLGQFAFKIEQNPTTAHPLPDPVSNPATGGDL